MTMRERPIIFSGDMVQAILDGRKTMTRRVIKPQSDGDIKPFQFPSGMWGWISNTKHQFGSTTAHCCPYGQVGDLLWVRETWMRETEQGCPTGAVIYRATDRPESDGDAPLKWKPAIHMPHEYIPHHP